MRPVWLDQNSSLVAAGHCEPLDPGLGADRYEAAHRELLRSSRDFGFASFTFDPEGSGSIVLIPENTIHTPPAPTQIDNPYRVVDDGISMWQEGFTRLTDAISSGQVEKVVLARQVTIEADHDIDIPSVVSNLKTQNPGCYVFEVGGLVGASPELLVSLVGTRLTTNVLAGTGRNESDLRNQKTREEHRFAVESALAALDPHLSSRKASSQRITRQGSMIHAATTISGETKPGTGILDVLTDLHPTAAVGGTPTDKAIDLIREYEAPRGRYGGPIGWFNREGEGVFAIALRCASVVGSKATLFAGGGLVKGSERNSELAETELKLRPMFDALQSDRAAV